MICFLAFILRTVFYKKLKEKEKNLSYTQVITHLKALQASELEIKDERVKIRTELQPRAVLAFNALGMRPLNRILSQENMTGVVVRA